MFECSLDAVGFYPCTSPRTYDDLAPGSHTFRVRAIDAAGRVDLSPASLTWTVPAPTADVPENDAFADAIALRTASGSFDTNNTGATKEPGEPNHAGNVGGHSLWFRWHAPRAGTVTMETRGPSIDTLLAVYTGSSVGALTRVASSDDVPGATTSKVSFSATAGSTYRIALDGKNGATGYTSSSYNASLGAPPNDNFANREALSGPSGTVYASNVGATAEAGEPGSQFYPQPMSIWYRWTAPRSGLFSFDVNGSATGFSFDLYTGSSLSTLAPAGVKVGGGRSGQIYLVAASGVTYVIRLDDQYNPGDWVLNWSDGASPGGADTTPPSGPTVSSTPPPGWSNDNTVDVTWRDASDDGSGVDGYSYEWSQSATTVPDTVKDAEETATGTTSPSLADGQWWFHLRTGDTAGNWSPAVHLGPFKIDTAAPANPALSSTHPPDWSADRTVDVAWSGAADGTSGVAGYSVAWSGTSTTSPDETVDTTVTSAMSDPLADGSWWFHLRTRDRNNPRPIPGPRRPSRRPRGVRRATRWPTAPGGSTCGRATMPGTGRQRSIWARSRSTQRRPRTRSCGARATPSTTGPRTRPSSSRGMAEQASTAIRTSGRATRTPSPTRRRTRRRPRRASRRSGPTGPGGSTCGR